ncbi:MAG TPA: PH domain-containing protein [Streptosporangiaceae bacterium]
MSVPEFMMLRDFGSRSIDKYLMPYELTRLTIRRHPASLMAPIAAAFGGLVLAGAVNSWLGAGGGITMILWLAWLGLVGWLVWRLIAWSMTYFVITEYRVTLISGVLNRRVAMIPGEKVSDITLDRSLLGRIFGYGTIVMESTGQDQALKNVHYMPYPEQLYLDISSMISLAKDESPDY